MTIEKHLLALKAKHEALDVAIEEENSHPLPDQTKISDLKKKKLAIKEEIEQLSSAK